MRKFVVGVVMLALLVIGARGIHDLMHRHGSAVQEVTAHPMPGLFPQADLTSYTTGLDGEAAKAAALMKGWWSAHGTRPQDKVFAAWVKRQIPRPPSAQSRKAEATQLVKLAGSRDVSGEKATRWLKLYGAHDLWLYYEHQQATRLATKERNARHMQLGRVLGMSKRLGRSLGQELKQPAPYLIDPAIRSGKQSPAPQGSSAQTSSAQTSSGQTSSGQTSSGPGCPCSYPAGADASAAGGSAFLSLLYPQQASTYRHLADEYEYAQLYSGSRLPSDLDAGRLLGDMVAEYFLVTRGDVSVQHITTALADAGSSHARSAGAPGSTAVSSGARG